jgi:hypothetical protein
MVLTKRAYSLCCLKLTVDAGRFAEMEKDTKNGISHRRKAVNALKAYLESNMHLLAAAEEAEDDKVGLPPEGGSGSGSGSEPPPSHSSAGPQLKKSRGPD